MTISIEPGVPLPLARRFGGKSKKYPFDSMQVGDSFAIQKPSKYVESSIHGAAKRSGVKVAVRKIDGGGIRVWRIE